MHAVPVGISSYNIGIDNNILTATPKSGNICLYIFMYILSPSSLPRVSLPPVEAEGLKKVCIDLNLTLGNEDGKPLNLS